MPRAGQSGRRDERAVGATELPPAPRIPGLPRDRGAPRVAEPLEQLLATYRSYLEDERGWDSTVAATCRGRRSTCATAGVIPPASTTCPPLTSRASSWPKQPRAQPTDGQRDGRAAAISPALLLPVGPDLGSLGPGDTVDGQLRLGPCLAPSTPRSGHACSPVPALSTLSGAREFAHLERAGASRAPGGRDRGSVL